MTSRRASALVRRWVRLYTRHLPAAVAQRRIDEIHADLHDHVAHERERGTSDRRIALGILSRTGRGLAADAAWRRRVRTRKARPMRIILAVLGIALGIAAFVAGGADDSPGLQLIGVLIVAGTIAFNVRRARRSR